MSTVYGQLSFSASNNSEVDFVNLAKALNEFSWSDGQHAAKWVHSANDGTFEFESVCVEDPTGFPKIYIAELEDPVSGVLEQKNAQYLTENDYDNLLDLNGEDADFKMFADEIKPFIRNGFIQITCDASDRKGLSYWEQITINSDGTGIASSEIHRANGKVIKISENF